MHGSWIIHAMGAFAAAAALTGCVATSERGVLSNDPVQRREAIVEAAVVLDEKAIVSLITRLDSQDPGERLLSITSLERITHQTLGYDFAGSEPARAEAVERWTAWARDNGYAGTGAADLHTSSGKEVKR